MNEENVPVIIAGGKHTDERGTLTYFNDLNLSAVKRLYVLEHPDPGIVRAWQGHQYENKWFYVVEGSFKIVLIRPDDWLSPAEDLQPQEFSLTSAADQVLHVPGGFASGFQALEPDSKMMVFSNFSIAESLNDDFRFNKSKWYNW
jgi:dTDP-4-dehydrorhamnose 3,5-epimerase-like enzyme